MIEKKLWPNFIKLLVVFTIIFISCDNGETSSSSSTSNQLTGELSFGWAGVGYVDNIVIPFSDIIGFPEGSSRSTYWNDIVVTIDGEIKSLFNRSGGSTGGIVGTSLVIGVPCNKDDWVYIDGSEHNVKVVYTANPSRVIIFGSSKNSDVVNSFTIEKKVIYRNSWQ